MSVEPEAMAVELDPISNRDPQLCHHYTKEIFSYLRDLELEHRVAPHFMQVSFPLRPSPAFAMRCTEACLAESALAAEQARRSP